MHIKIMHNLCYIREAMTRSPHSRTAHPTRKARRISVWFRPEDTDALRAVQDRLSSEMGKASEADAIRAALRAYIRATPEPPTELAPGPPRPAPAAGQVSCPA
jgi:hypothetical protein